MIHHLTRATRHLIFWSLITAALGLTCIRLALSGIEDYKTRMADKIGEMLDVPVTIDHLRTAMRGFSPELVLSGIAVTSADSENKTAIALKEIRLGIDLLDVLISRELLASSWVTLIGAKLSVIRKPDGSFAIVGLKAGDSKPLWLLQGGKYEVLDSEITWQDEKIHGRSLTFESVDMALINDDERHRINVVLQLPKKFGESLRVSMDVSGNLFEPSDIHGSAYIEGEKIRLPEWVTVDLPYDVKVNAGSGDLKVWGEWRDSKLASITGLVQTNDLILQRRDTGEFAAEHLKSRFHLALTDNRWQLDVKQFLLETPGSSGAESKIWPNAIFSVGGMRSDKNPLHQVALFAENLDLQELSLVAQFFIPSTDAIGKLVRQAEARGMLHDFSLFAVPDEKAVAVNGKFTGLDVASMFSIPGLENLTGRILGNEKQGSVQLASKDARLTSVLFRKPLAVDRLEGALSWRQSQDEWIVSSPMIELDSLSFKSKNRLRVTIPKAGGQTFMDFQSAFASDDAAQAPGYLPVTIMDTAVVDWLDRAFIKGRVPKGGLLFYGKPDDFPFADGTGVFETLFDVEQLELEFDPLWPHLTNVDGEILFYQGGLSGTLYQGLSNNIKIRQAKVSIPSLGKSEQLLVQGEAEGKIGQALGYLQKTPLSPQVDKLLDASLPEGDTQVKLDMKVPIREGADMQVDGSAQLKNARLRVNSLDLPVSQISGLIKFNEDGVYSDTINAQALGHPIQVHIQNADRETLVSVTGRAGVEDLRAQFKMPWWQRAEGETDYKIQLSLPYDGNSPELHVQSDLAGIALDLPGILAKTQDQKKPVSMIFKLADKFFLPVELNYDNILKAAVKIDIKQKKVDSGHVLLGTGVVAQRQEPGIKFEVKRDQLALQEWLGLSLASVRENGKNADFREITVHTQHALWNDSDVGAVDLSMRLDGDVWSGALSSKLATGKLELPNNPSGTGRIVLDLDKLNISGLTMLKGKNEETRPDSAPEFLPLLSVSSKKTFWRSASLGRFFMETERSPEGLVFKRIELNGADQKLSLTGDWKVTGTASFTEAKGRLEIPKASRLFSKLGISNDLTETNGVIDFSFNWQAPPYRFLLKNLYGSLDVNFKSGRILSIEPGFGRVLGILAMAQWFKRLQLDFSDVYEEGMAFNSIKGRFDLAKGKAVTHNLVVDAVPAKITISGETDLVNRTVDHIVNVAPKSADAVPIAGTIMGKVAALVSKSLTGEEHEGLFFGSQYLVKGEWSNAKISSLHENEGLVQKTWNGITDFPWLKQQDTK